MILEEIKNIKSGNKEIRKFAVSVGIVIGLVGIFLWWRDKDYSHYFVIISVAMIVLGLAVPVVLKPIQKLWMALAIVLGWVMTRIILCVLYYLVVTPIGVIGRLFGKEFLDIKFRKKTDSYWIEKEVTIFEKEKYEKQY